MVTAPAIERRLILRRLAGGGAIFCTVLGARQTRTHAAVSPMPARKPPLIILDAGHGGRDPGATGASGILEKDITLASALTLKTALEARGHYRVALTRSQDEFVSRDHRVDMTRDLGANLFLSLHADCCSNATVRGASVYTLAKQATDAETEALANRENGAGNEASPAALTSDISGILASLAARETRVASSRMARQLVHGLERDSSVLASPERQANFTVLRAAGIPSVLIEMGFLSNPEDEAALNDAEHRERIAQSMTRAVDAWFFPAGGMG